MLADYAPSESANIATAYLSTMVNIGSALGAITAGALTMFLNVPTIFKLASIITLTGVFAVALIRTRDKPSLTCLLSLPSQSISTISGDFPKTHIGIRRQ